MTVAENDKKTLGAHVLINCRIDERNALLYKINNLENVTETKNVSGRYDIITKIIAKNKQSLMATIRDDLGKIVNVESVITLIHTDLQNPCGMPDMTNQISCNDWTHIFAEHDYACCEQCGALLPHCHCTCPYCGERDRCECGLFDAATGG